VGVAEDIVISMVVFLFLSLRNTNGTVFQGANSSSSAALTSGSSFFIFLPYLKLRRLYPTLLKKSILLGV
jgi:hypothetical protein